MTWNIKTLFERHAGEIARSLRRRGMTPETAADITQDTFVRALASPPADTSAIRNPAAYLFRVARNLGIDQARRERLMQRVAMTAEDFAAIADPSPGPETIVYDRQRLALVKAALEELPERTRVAFELHRLGGYTMAEIADQLGTSTTRVWAAIRDAYEHVESRLDGL